MSDKSAPPPKRSSAQQPSRRLPRDPLRPPGTGLFESLDDAANGGRGVVVLPTGAGKTVVAFLALSRVPVRTLVVVPTIELPRQWRSGLIEAAGLPADQ